MVSYAQTNGHHLEDEIDSLIAEMKALQALRDSVDDEINSVDEQIMEMQYELARREFGPGGYPAIIRSDQCDLTMSGTDGLPGRGDKVLVTGATHDGYWKIAYREGIGTARDHCLRFADRTIDAEVLLAALVEEAKAQFEVERQLRDSIAAVRQAREDSIASAERARIAARVAEIEAEYDAIGKTNFPIRIHDVWIAEMNSAGGVTVAMNAQYFKKSKTIKYLHFTLIPYNAVGDKIKCEIRGTSEFIGRVTGPVTSQYEPFFWFWETAWYNSAIKCIKVSKVKVEYTDGTTYTYVRELPRILGEFDNLCH